MTESNLNKLKLETKGEAVKAELAHCVMFMEQIIRK